MSRYSVMFIYFDPFGIKTFSDLVSNLSKKAAPAIRKRGFETYLSRNNHQVYSYEQGNIYVMSGAKYNETEFHIAEKLTTAGYHIMFPNAGDLGKTRKNDVYLYDTKIYVQYKAELKSLFGTTADVVKSRLICGAEQASIIVYDVQSSISTQWFIKGLRQGWSRNIRKILVNWHGRWHEFKKDDVFSREIHKILK